MLLASASRHLASKIAENLGCGSQTVRNAIHDFNERGMAALVAGSSVPKQVHAAFDEAEGRVPTADAPPLPREFGKESSLWTLEMVAEVTFEEGLTERRVRGETIRATLSRLLGVSWKRAKRWISSPIPNTNEKKEARSADGSGRRESGVGVGL